MKRIGVIIVAAGSGSRMGGKLPKQFMPVGGVPILVLTLQRVIETFSAPEIVVVISPDEESRWKGIADEFDLAHTHRVCYGGATRFDSVRNAVQTLGECDLIAVHDGVRPFFTQRMVDNLIAEASAQGAAIPTIQAIDSYRILTPDGDSKVVDRTLLRAIQTPQIFDGKLLRHAYQTATDRLYTDDASLVESFGTKIALCNGEYSNIKITTPADIAVAETIISTQIR